MGDVDELPMPAVPEDLDGRLIRRVSWRILPFLLLLYLVAYLDRVNVSYANLEMSKDLGFSAAVFGFGAGLFTVDPIVKTI